MLNQTFVYQAKINFHVLLFVTRYICARDRTEMFRWVAAILHMKVIILGLSVGTDLVVFTVCHAL